MRCWPWGRRTPSLPGATPILTPHLPEYHPRSWRISLAHAAPALPSWPRSGAPPSRVRRPGVRGAPPSRARSTPRSSEPWCDAGPASVWRAEAQGQTGRRRGTRASRLGASDKRAHQPPTPRNPLLQPVRSERLVGLLLSHSYVSNGEAGSYSCCLS